MPPYTTRMAKRHTKKADTPRLKRQWRDVARSAAERGASEGSAIRQANAVVGRDKKYKWHRGKRTATRSRHRSRRA